MRLVLFVIFSLVSSALQADEIAPRQIRYLAPSTGTPPQEYYFTEVLTAALAKADTPYVLIPITGFMQQKRLMASLDQGQFDVLWTMTSSLRETQARPIRIPLTLGLFGYRQLVVKRDNKTVFNQIANLEQLKRQLCAQGRHWPDLEILKRNDFRVAAADGIREIYRLINQGLTDYTARSVLEVEQELERFSALDVEAVNEYLVYYPTAMYFFVREDDEQLFNDISAGLNAMIESGELMELLASHSKYKRAVNWLLTSPPDLWRINNPLLPKETPVNQSQYWLSSAN